MTFLPALRAPESGDHSAPGLNRAQNVFVNFIGGKIVHFGAPITSSPLLLRKRGKESRAYPTSLALSCSFLSTQVLFSFRVPITVAMTCRW